MQMAKGKVRRLISRVIAVTCFSVLLFALSTQAQETDAQKLLLDSIESLDVAGVKTALDEGANPNSIFDESKHSVIATLAFGGDDWRWVAVKNPDRTAAEILQMLFEAGARIQSCDQGILYFPIAHGWALFTEMLLTHGVSPSRKIEGETPMEIAVSNGQTSIVEVLRKHGVRALESRDAVQQRLIGAAANYDIPGMENAIKDGADVNGKNRQGETALIEACGVMSILDSATVLYLLGKGADPRIQGADDPQYPDLKTTALHHVMSWSSSVLNEKVIDRFKDAPAHARTVIKALLQHGALVSARDYYGRTPLHIAARWNNIVGATMLIEAGSKIMPKDNKGKTPLDYAESAEMIKLLKDHGAKEE
jgi:ankyrin repeat protein